MIFYIASNIQCRTLVSMCTADDVDHFLFRYLQPPLLVRQLEHQ